MPRSLSDIFPKLQPENHRITSPETVSYNCLAWAVHDEQRWWEPSGFSWHYWPEDASTSQEMACYIQAFELHGFINSDTTLLEEGFEKIAIYASPGQEFTHVARQLQSGKWTSKLGGLQDIEHDTLDLLEGGDYGTIHQVMKRPTPANIGS